MAVDDDEAPGDPDLGLALSTFTVDAFGDLAISRWPGNHAVYLLVGGRLSAPHRLSVGFSERMSDAATTWHVGDQRRRIHSHPVWPAAATGHVADDGDVELASLDTPGIVLRTEPVFVTGPRRRAVVEGSFFVPLQPQDRVRIRRGEKLAILRKAMGPQAVIPVNLLVTPDDRPSIFHLPLAVPTDAVVDVGRKAHATGRFVVDLLAFEDMWTTPHPLHLYAFSSGLASEPKTVRVLPESLIPQRTPPPRPKTRGSA